MFTYTIFTKQHLKTDVTCFLTEIICSSETVGSDDAEIDTAMHTHHWLASGQHQGVN